MDFFPSWLNPFDALIVLALLAGAAWGFVRGLIRVTLSLLVLYIATILAMSFYQVFGQFIFTIFGMPREFNEALAFVIILVVTVIIANTILGRTYKDTELPGIRQIDQLGGLIIGFFVFCIWIGLAIIVVNFLLNASVAEDSALLVNLQGYFQSSNLIPVFYRFLPIALSVLRPWVPKGQLPEIFTLAPF